MRTEQGTNLQSMALHSSRSLEAVAKLPMRQRVAALTEAIMIVPTQEREGIAIQLIEIASFQSPGSHPASGTASGSAASPFELIARFSMRQRQRASDEAMLGVARAWTKLSTPMRELAVGLGRDRWLWTTRKLARENEPQSRLAAAMISRDTADPGLGKVVGELLADEDQAVRHTADQAIMRMTIGMLDHLPAELLGEELSTLRSEPRIEFPVDPEVLKLEQCILLRAIADSAWSFAAHRCRSPLLAAMLLIDRTNATPMEQEISARMRRLLGEKNHPSHSPMRTVLRRTPTPILRERAFRWLTIGPMSSAAADRLAIAESIQEHEVVLGKASLAIRPKRAARLPSVRQLTRHTAGHRQLSDDGPIPPRSMYHQLSTEARVGLIRFSSFLTIDDQIRRDLREPMLADPSRHVRLLGCETSSSIERSDYIYDVDHSIARHAAMSWSSAGQPAPKAASPANRRRTEIAKTNLRSPHAWVRRVAKEELDRLGLVDPGSPASRVLARRMYKSDPAGFVRLIRDRLADPSMRSDVIMMIRIMGIEHRFELDLIAVMQSEDGDPRARATAVMALGKIDSNSARYMLNEAISAQDPRVRANACEVIDFDADQFVELKADPNHRVRANALRRMILDSKLSQLGQVRQAGQGLLEMLHDRRPMHRLAGTWVAQRSLVSDQREAMGSCWNSLVAEIDALAHSQDDLRVQSRAQRCIERIETDLRHAQRSSQRASIDPLDPFGYMGSK